MAKSNICIYCGKPCDSRHERCYRCAMDLTKGEKHHNWKGGKISDREGYIRILKPEHPRANQIGYVLEHILIWEQTHDKHLPKGWIIHHLNGIKHDNQPHNLIALPSKKHSLILQAKAKRIQELEALLNGQNQLL